jgi:hypothetical protein
MHSSASLYIPAHALLSADPGDVCAQNGLICAVSKVIAEELPAEPNGGYTRAINPLVDHAL